MALRAVLRDAEGRYLMKTKKAKKPSYDIVTDEIRADLVASALTHFVNSPEGAAWEQRMRDGKLKIKVLKE